MLGTPVPPQLPFSEDKKKDFIAAINRFNVDNKAIENMSERIRASLNKWHDFIDISFITCEMKKSYHDLINEKASEIYSA